MHAVAEKYTLRQTEPVEMSRWSPFAVLLGDSLSGWNLSCSALKKEGSRAKTSS